MRNTVTSLAHRVVEVELAGDLHLHERSGTSSWRANTCTSSTPHAATRAEEQLAGRDGLPGQPFWTGPSTTKCWSRVLQSTRPKTSVVRACADQRRWEGSGMAGM